MTITPIVAQAMSPEIRAACARTLLTVKGSFSELALISN